MKIKVTTSAILESNLPPRQANAYKGEFGKVLIVGGSIGYTGAPVLAARAALRSGSGLIYVAVPESVYSIVACKLDEPMVFPYPQENGKFSAQAVTEILNRLSVCDVCLLGPGMGVSSGTAEVAQAIVNNSRVPVVLDADGLNVFAGNIDKLRNATCPLIVTPHEGEFLRMGGRLELGRIGAAVEMALRIGAVVLLKGHKTVITDGETVYENNTGNPGMATGGSGDVLGGILVSLMGQGVPPLEAAAAGAWLHGAAGDLCAQELGQSGMTPGDMIGAVARLLRK